MEVLFGNDIPGPRDIVLICLVDACGVLRELLTARELERASERIEQVRKLDLIGQAVSKAVWDIQSSIALAMHRRSEERLRRRSSSSIIRLRTGRIESGRALRHHKSAARQLPAAGYGAMPFLRSSSMAWSVLRRCSSPMPRRTWAALVNWMLV